MGMQRRRAKRVRRRPSPFPQRKCYVRTTSSVLVLLMFLLVWAHAPINYYHEFSMSPPMLPPRMLEASSSTPSQEAIPRVLVPAFCGNLTLLESDTMVKIPQTVTVVRNTTAYGGQPFAIHIYARNDVVSSAIRDNWWDEDKTKLMIEKIQVYAAKHDKALSDLTFVDVGANLGWFTLIMASLGLQVIAIEPMPNNLIMLRRSLCLPENQALVSRITLHAKGVSSRSQSCVLYSDFGNFGDGILHCPQDGDTRPFVAPPRTLVRGQVEVVRMDDLLSPNGPSIVAVKLDTEGHEGHVLEGGRRILLESSIPYLFTEFNPSWMARQPQTDAYPLSQPRAFLQALVQANYTVQDESATAPLTSPVSDLLDRTWIMHDLVLEYHGHDEI